MNTFLFQFTGPIAAGQYLLGSPSWSEPVAITSVRLTCLTGTSTEATVFQIEVDGVAQKAFRVMPDRAGQLINIPLPIKLTIPAEAEIRVSCVTGPSTTEGALREIGLTLYAPEASSATPLTGEMFVNWVNGPEKLRLFDYNPSTHQFTEASSGVSATRATIDNSTGFTATIQGTVAARSIGDQLASDEFICNGGTAASESPRLEFFIGSQRVATLTKTGLFYVGDIDEAASVTAGTNRFSFHGTGGVIATIGPAVDGTGNILTAIECVEPT